jgi:hypothetical protein
MKDLVTNLVDTARAMNRAVVEQALPLQLVTLEVVLEVSDDCGIREIAEALASKNMTIRSLGIGRGRIELTSEGLEAKREQMEAARDRCNSTGCEP